MKKLVCIIVASIILQLTPAKAAFALTGNIYVVKPGDSLTTIADKFDTNEEELIATNGLQSPSLKAGQKLLIPIMYQVVSTDSLQKLAADFHTSIEAIKSANGLSMDSLQVGQFIKIPPKRLMMQGQYILMTREEFKDWLFHQRFTRKISLIQQHHTWLPAYEHFHGSNHFAMLTSMENFHKKRWGWQNIAQNITTFPDGKVAVCRPFDVAPEGSIGANANSAGIAIENVGNFDIGHDVMTEQQKETIIYVAALLSMKFGLTPSIDTITYHHWWNVKTGERVLDNAPPYNVKSCPGTGFFGGNTTTSATNHFYPLVLQKMQEIQEKERYTP
jgi:LysM repeat protein